MKPAIELHNLAVGYGTRRLIDGCSGAIPDGSLTALIGRNGAGKSSLIRVLAGIDKPLEGSVVVGGRDLASMGVAQRAKAMALVTTERVRVANLRCRDLVAMGRAPYTNWIGHMRPADTEIVDAALRLTGMEAYADRTLDHMSDGECQRVMIARALAQDTPLILLDEPTSYLDLPNRYDLCMLLRSMTRSQGRTVVFSTHELDIALQLCDYIALVDTPHLHILPTVEMAVSGHIERLFSNTNVAFDPRTLRITATSADL